MNDTRSSRGSSLERPLARSLRVTVDEAAVQRMWSGIERRLPRERAPRASRGLWLAFAALLVAAVVWLGTVKLVPSGHVVEPRALLLADGRAFESIENGVAHFADGSRVEAGPGARVEALASTPGELSLLLRRGRARFVVTPGGPRRWSIDARGVRVEVVGTVLSVEASARAVHVAVEVGAVLVRSPLLPDGVRRLTAGQDVELALERAAPPQLVEPPSSELPVSEPAVSEPLEQPASSPSTAAARQAPKSREARRRSPPAAPSSQRNDAARELWARADAARSASQPDLAIELLEQLLREHPDDAQAPLGAFTLGTVLAEQREPERAAQAFRRALELGLPSVLRDLCLRRLQELESEQGPRGGASVSR